jgi:hypothetical protein
MDPDDGLTIRKATEADRKELALLALLSTSEVPRGDVLVAEVGGELWAACSLADGLTISDPFRPTEPARSLLETRCR